MHGICDPTDSATRTDELLLRQWAAERSPEAFATLMRRYVNFVHGVATRALNGDRHMADDVTQAVFLILSEKAARLRARPSLAAWLHRTTHYAAANAKRIARRRMRHERAAAIERSEVSMDKGTLREDAPADEKLDHAIRSLGHWDRNLILDHFFCGHDIDAMAAAAGASRATTQRRLSRAIHRLRSRMPLAALPAVLAGAAAHSADAKLTAHIQAAATGADASASVVAIVRATRYMMMQETMKSAGKWSLLLLCWGAFGIGAWRTATAFAQPATMPATQAASGTSTAPKPDLEAAKAMVGTWEFVDVVNGGRVVPRELIAAARVVISDARIEVIVPGRRGTERSAYSLAAGEHFIEIDQRDASNPTRVIPGILQLDGDRLQIGFDDRNAKVRPPSFDAAGRAGKLWVLRRLEVQKPAPAVP
ncbi:MAG TPA: sigma-70 family RNA polymerase sigma factor [Tepidisphaeraceae bacterium]|jgi:RNA polymerase sigma factor (sigma-70 family)